MTNLTDIKLSTGRVVKRKRMLNGAIDANIEGGIEMTEAEWKEFVSIISTKKDDKLEPYNEDHDHKMSCSCLNDKGD